MSLTHNDLGNVVHKTYPDRNKWCEICRALGVDSADIDNISESYRDNGDCLREGLWKWLRGEKRNMSQLENALRDVRNEATSPSTG